MENLHTNNVISYEDGILGQGDIIDIAVSTPTPQETTTSRCWYSIPQGQNTDSKFQTTDDE